MKRLYSAFICATGLMVPLAGHAAVTAKDIQVAARILSFSDNPPTGDVKLAIVYDPANAASTADEQSLVGILGSGLKVGNITLIAVPTTIGDIGSETADVLFLTGGLGVEGAKARSQAKTLCMTTDISATQAGYCAISIQTVPSVQITVNKAAASTASSFASAFLMMVTEI